ncbi:hypothetical protein V6U78_00295 [Marinospirillum sp. MEB164]|uniref:Pre-peptidase C-terminal domain-containing protein n=1 Tax=Marinospirillum alkalitolerans TaxID=3123374 RepID=A0ABW8PU91_9GAMM
MSSLCLRQPIGWLCLGVLACIPSLPLLADDAEAWWDQAPTYQSVEAGLMRQTARVQAGGGTRANQLGLPSSCRGFINQNAPDLHFVYPDGAPQLPVYIHAESSADTTLVVRTPSGQWLCDDDTIGLDPVVNLRRPEVGTYQVWVGTYLSRGMSFADVHFSLNDPTRPAPGQRASNEPDWTQAPRTSEIQLNAGFVPDPYTRQLTVGGSDEVDWELGEGSCRGHIDATAPDAVINYQASSSWSTLYIRAASTADTTLVVRTPEGRWLCNDDAIGLDPVVDVNQPDSGAYAVWIGTYAAHRAGTEASLEISELNPRNRTSSRSTSEPSARDHLQGLNWDANPLYQHLSLQGGFLPDPREIEIRAGGSTGLFGAGQGCTGYVNADTPDITLDYQAGSLPLHIHASSERDTTLVVRAPNGDFFCNDDAIGLDPVVDIRTPETGRYAIWVGTFSQSAMGTPARVAISEMDPRRRQQAAAAEALNWESSATAETLSLRAGFTPDPRLIELNAGGQHRVSSSMGYGCVGNVNASAPDVTLNYTAGASALHFRADSRADTTLVIRAPDGTWHCNDDAIGLDPVVDFHRPQTGAYHVWVGVYSGQQQPAVLKISEINPRSY